MYEEARGREPLGSSDAGAQENEMFIFQFDEHRGRSHNDNTTSPTRQASIPTKPRGGSHNGAVATRRPTHAIITQKACYFLLSARYFILFFVVRRDSSVGRAVA